MPGTHLGVISIPVGKRHRDKLPFDKPQIPIGIALQIAWAFHQHTPATVLPSALCHQDICR
jgi:hypothetical protein